MDDIKLFAKNEIELETLIQAVKLLREGLRMGFGKETICHANNEKRKTTNNGRNRTTKSRQNQNRLGKKRNLKNTRKYWKRNTVKHAEGWNKKKNRKKSILGERENYSETKIYNRNLIKWINTCDVFPRKILGIILKVDKPKSNK